ncbi:hypothetical protein AKJ09_02014 [Labilithrix luteola]|uniref:Uncharacterized protein n=1 Tax=Labilithrix luteola TaxID=1391654 RepID=A0A0K1PP83_9BACT|nr:hypothetical protein [Labilithrix luteola]AKU95350.1 hypothetical protein AKJ09_02014 [Labilithrix luteola]
MKDPIRLSIEDKGIERLLSATRRERPSPEQIDKALVRMTAAAALPPSVPALATSLSSRTWMSTWLPWTAVVGVAAIAMAGTVWTKSSTRSAPTPNTGAPVSGSVEEPQSAQPVPAVNIPPEVVSAEVVMRIDDLPTARTTESNPSRSVLLDAAAPAAPIARTENARPAVEAPTNTFPEELKFVVAARSALAGDPRASLRNADAYDARFPHGIFSEEIDAIRIEALAATGESARARALGERFLSEKDSSPYAGRVRTVLRSIAP